MASIVFSAFYISKSNNSTGEFGNTYNVRYEVECTIVCLFVFFIFSHGVVSLFYIYEFDCPFGIFRPSFGQKLVYDHKIVSRRTFCKNKIPFFPYFTYKWT